MWGAGTALGELPPYFMARAARLSGRPPDEDKEDLIEFEELLKKEKHPETMVNILLLFDWTKNNLRILICFSDNGWSV